MLSFLASQLRHRTSRALTLALGIVVAAVAFILLTGSAATSAIHVRRTLRANFRPAYDILVRPRNSFTPLERTEGLVRANYLSGIYGGITLGQYRTIEHLPGVGVAAPIANVGYVFLYGSVHIRLNSLLDAAPYQLYRIKIGWLADGGLSRYPMTDLYVYYTPRDRFVLSPPGDGDLTEVVQGRANPIPVCQGFGATIPPVSGPFDPNNDTGLSCYSPHSSKRLLRWVGERPGVVEATFPIVFPVLLSAIDPEQEAKLVHLGRTVVSGRYLRASDQSHVGRTGSVESPIVPVLESTRAYLGDSLAANIERLQVPRDVSVPDALVAGACHGIQVPCPKDLAYRPPPGSHRNAYQFLRHLSGRTIAQRTYPAARLSTHPHTDPAFGGTVIWSSSYWTVSATSYRTLGPDRLEPIPRAPSQGVWYDPSNGNTGYFLAPTDNEDVQFRSLHEVTGSTVLNGNHAPLPALKPVGRFDPSKLPGFSALSQVPLETYYPPELEPGDGHTRALLHDKPLLPSQNLGGYIAQPPLLLTTLRALPALLSRQAFPTESARFRHAPISVVRVRVEGVTGPNDLSETRVRTVAQLIHDQTGLDVDITAGSSPRPIAIDLPAGKFGRPPLVLKEGWVQKGASVSYLRSLDRKDLALFALVLVVCAIFLLNGALAAVRARRAELGTLLTLGWSRPAVFRAVLGELALIGLVAGAAGTGLAAILVAGLNLALPLTRTLYVLPIAVGLAALGGLAPAWQATRGTPLDALRPPVRARWRGRSVRSLPALALVNLTRLPFRTALGAAGLALGVAALTVLVAIERSFQGTLVSTLLGNAISLQIRGPDFVAIGLTIALAAVSAADVLYLNLRERAAEFVTLETTGWSQAQLGRVVLFEAATLGLLAALTGAAVGIAIGGGLLGVPYGPLALAALIAGAGAFAAATLASLAPTVQLLRVPAPSVLAAE